jgi:IS30 family transposase
MSIHKIAKIMNRDWRTIQREIARGTRVQRNSDLTEKKVYLADAGERTARENDSVKGRTLKIGHCHKLAEFVTEKIVEEKYSPYAAIEAAKRETEPFEVMICFKTLYNYIAAEVFVGLTNKDLPVKKNRKASTYKRVRRVALNNLEGRSIEERPVEVADREEEGHWEMDCVVGASGTKACLLVLTERKSRQELIFKMSEKTQANVLAVIKRLERKYGAAFKERFKTITMDNGAEFLDSKGLEGSAFQENTARTAVYYAHPYSAYERGSNENANRIIRRFIPKGCDIGTYSDEDVARVQHWMNHYPRRLFIGKSAYDIANFFVAA